MRPRGPSLVLRASNSLRTSSPLVSLETLVSLSACFVCCSASRSGPRRDHAEPRTIQAVLPCGTKNCSSVTKAMEHFQTLYATAGAERAAKSILCRVGDCVSVCAEAGEFEAEDPKSKPGGIPLASLSGREARGVLGTGGRPRGPRSEMSDVSGFHVKDVMDMDQDELIQNMGGAFLRRTTAWGVLHNPHPFSFAKNFRQK